MQNRKLIFITVGAFAICAIALPFVLEWLYMIGEEKPLIILHYSQSDMMMYFITIIGLLISIVALIISLDNNKLHFRVDHAITASHNGIAIMIQIQNTSLIACEIHEVNFYSKRLKGYCGILDEPPFRLDAKATKDIIIPVGKVHEYIGYITSNKSKRFEYAIRTSIGQEFYYTTRELVSVLREYEKHMAGKKQSSK